MPVIFTFEIDGTICSIVEGSQYELARPFEHIIEEINRLHEAGHVIKVLSSRGVGSGEDFTEMTRRQLSEWGLKYHDLIVAAKADVESSSDNGLVHVEAWLKPTPPVRGVVAGAFDLIHPGYVRMFADAKGACTHLTVALHVDPSVERPSKLRPVLTIDERVLILRSIRYVDDVIVYHSEDDLYELLRDGEFDVRFIGDDYRDQPEKITGGDLNINIHWIDRSHSYSTTRMKKAIHDTVAEKT